MYYLVIENLGRKRCIDKHETNLFKDDHFYDCLRKLPFDEKGKTIVGKIKIRCLADPYAILEAFVYSE